jgi:RHS repeat-associated protein
MKAAQRLLGIFVFGIVFFSVSAFAQTLPDEEQGLRPYGSWHGGDLDSVSLTNGGLVLHIPLATFPQRGNLDLSFSVRFSSKQWQHYVSVSGRTSGWRPAQNTGTQIVSSVDWWMQSSYSQTSDASGTTYSWSRSVTAPDGNTHSLGGQTDIAGVGSPLYPLHSLDATSLLHLDTHTLILPNGTRYAYPAMTDTLTTGRTITGPYIQGMQASTITDANGNQIAIGASGWTDTLGRQIPGYSPGSGLPVQPGVPTSDLSTCPSGTASALLWNVPGPANVSSGIRTFKFCYSNVTIAPVFNGVTIYGPTTWSMLTAIVLPDLTLWTFSYDSDGDVTRLGFPTGGSISYTYAMGPYNCGSGQTQSKWVISRTVDANDGAGGRTWTYTYSIPASTTYSQAGTAVVTGPDGNDVVHSISNPVSTGYCSGYDVQTKSYQGSSTSGTLLRTVQTQYNGQQDANSNTAINVVPVQTTSFLPGGKTSKVVNTYDAGVTNADGQHVIFGSLLQKDEYDFSNALVRSTLNHYLWQDSATYQSNNFLALLASTTIKDGAGSQAAQTTYTYDQGTVASSGIATQLVSPPAGGNVRGNQTKVNHWLNTNNSFISSSATYFDTGMKATSTDPNGNATSYSYSLSFAGAYVTQTKMPDTGSPAVHHIISGNFDFNTGLLTSFTDQNSQQFTYQYDNMLRLTQGNHPDGGQTAFNYPNATTVERLKKITTTLTDDVFAYFDGVGRGTRTKHVTPSGNALVDTTYDPLGRTATVTTPYFSTSELTYGITQNQYDALSRVAQTTKPDSSASTAQYVDNCVTTTDEAGKPRKSCSDALGRLIEVDEPNAGSTGTSSTASVVIGGSLLTVNSVVDSGTVSLTSGGFTATACFGNSTNSFCNGKPVNSTAAQVAAALASALNAFGSPINASVSGATLSLVWNTPGPFSPSVSALATTHDQPGLFANPSFTSPAASFAGGTGPSLSTNPYVTLYTYDVLDNLTCVEQHGAVAGTGCSANPSQDLTSPWRVRRFTYDSLSRLLTAANPESGLSGYIGVISYFYDANGNLLQKVSPAPNQTGTTTHTVSYCYDALNRVTGKAYTWQNCQSGQLPPGTAVVSYSYDSGTNGIGRLTSLTDQAGSATYTYDILGRVSSEQRTIAAVTKNMAYTYNLDGSVATVTYPSGSTITYTPDSAGRMLSAIDTGNNIKYVTGATYDATNALTGSTYGLSSSFTGIVNSFSFNNRLQPVTMWSSSPVRTLMYLVYDFHLGVGDNGNVWGITNNRDTTRSQSFTYDPLNRLLSAQNAGTDCNVKLLNGTTTEFWGNSYGYDAWGDLLQKTPTKCSAENLSVTAGVNNQLQGGYTYDAAGNMTHDATANLNYVFDPENRIMGAAGFTYTYDADGNRVEKANGSTGTLYWYMSPGIVAESDLTGNLKTEYIFFDGQRVARKDFPGNAVSYYFSDHLKTASVVTDASGTIQNESDYYPWGGELQFANNLDNHYKFTGKERDQESGLDYFGARHYSNSLGRFITPDWSVTPVPVPYADLTNPQSLNQYAYVGGNPASKADPDGHCCDLKDIGDFIGSAVNAFSSDHLGGGLRFTANSTAGQLGAAVGDAVATVQGVGETLLGATGEVAGVILDSTGVGAVAGVPLNVVSTALVVDGGSTTIQGVTHLARDVSGSSGSAPTPTGEKPNTGPKAEEAHGVTAGGQATNEHGQKLAPSGRPQVNNVSKTTREAAKNAANKGSGVIHDPNPTRGGPHFHTKRGTGKKKQDSTHYNYPK